MSKYQKISYQQLVDAWMEAVSDVHPLESPGWEQVFRRLAKELGLSCE